MRKSSSWKSLAIAGAILGLAGAVPARADNIVGGAVTGGSAFTHGGVFDHLTVPFGAVTTPVNTVGNDNFNGSPNLFAFAEKAGFVLTSDLAVDVGPNPILKGTIVDSDFVTFEPDGAGFGLIGHVDFAFPVLGIITLDGHLIASNFLGAAGITYLDPGAVGLEAGDSVTIDPLNPNRILWNTGASVPGDSVRVITAPTPEPTSVILLATILLGVSWTLKRKRI